MFRFIHTADLHLDSPFAGLLSLPVSMRNHIRESTFRAFTNLVDIAIREQIDFIVISGDIYDSANHSLRAQLRFMKELTRLGDRNIPVYMVHGNHDPMDGREWETPLPQHVTVFGTESTNSCQVVLPGKGAVAEIQGISYAAAAEKNNLSLRFTPGNSALLQIAVLHTNVDDQAGHGNYAPCSKQDLIRSGFDYWALGHVHTAQVLHESPWIVYPGCLQGRNIRETGSKGFFIVEVAAEKRIELSFIETDNVRWFTEKLWINDQDTIPRLLERLQERLEQLRGSMTGKAAVVRFSLEGKSNLHRELLRGVILQEIIEELRECEIEYMESNHGQMWIWVESIQVHTKSWVDISALTEDSGFAGDLLRLSTALCKNPLAFNQFADEVMEVMRSNPKLYRLAVSDTKEEQESMLHEAASYAVELLIEEAGDGE